MATPRAQKPKKKKKNVQPSRQELQRRQQAQQAAQPKDKQRTSMKEYFRGVKQEMKRVVWPTKKELGSYTVLVLVACGFFALLFWGIDSGFLAILKGLLGITM